MDLLLGFESLDNDLPIPLYSAQRAFDATSLDLHRSCSDPAGVRPIVNEAHDDGGRWLDAISSISQSSWQQHDPFLLSFPFDDILLAQGLHRSPEDTPSTVFTTSSDITDSPDSGNGHGRPEGNLLAYPTIDGEREWSTYNPVSLSSPMRALDFFPHDHNVNSFPITTNDLLSHSTPFTPNTSLAESEILRNQRANSIAVDPNFVNLGLVQSPDPGAESTSTAICGSLLNFEGPPFILSASLSPFNPVTATLSISNALPLGGSAPTATSSFKSASLHGWSDHETSNPSTKGSQSTLLPPESKTLARRQRRPLIPLHVYIPIKPPTRSAAQIRPPPSQIDISKSEEHAQHAADPISEIPTVAHESEARQSLRSSESDDYLPSPSPSLSAVRSSSPVSVFRASPPPRRAPKASTKRKSRRGRGKAKGSAALALAVVTQLGTSANDNVDPVALYQEGKLNMLGIRKRKNHPIPLPIPVPNLNKKSRGRKVPYIAPGDEGKAEAGFLSPTSAFYDIEDAESAESPPVPEKAKAEGDSYSVSTRSRRRSSVSMTAPVDPLADKRTSLTGRHASAKSSKNTASLDHSKAFYAVTSPGYDTLQYLTEHACECGRLHMDLGALTDDKLIHKPSPLTSMKINSKWTYSVPTKGMPWPKAQRVLVVLVKGHQGSVTLK
ncbi:hypothetical protein BJ165DRAFT_1554057 [Panaeolus papilionaceus]|nr:hypothetical protein BJ165DRAFT_1554057 [Panaeolus papilionaceus]